MKITSISNLVFASLIAVLTFGCGGGGGGSDAPQEQQQAELAPSTVNSLSSAQVYDMLQDDFDRGYYPQEILYRWQTPIPIYTADDPETETAIWKYEELTSGLVEFVEVETMDELINDYGYGLAVSIGTAVDWDGSPNPGNVSHEPGSPNAWYGYFEDGELDGITYINLGAEGYDDSTVGWHPSAVAEHEMGHALLGGGQHFVNFNGDEGLSGELLALVLTFYSNPIGTPLDQVEPMLP